MLENMNIGKGIDGLALIVGETPVVGSGLQLESGRWVQLLPSDWDKAQFRVADPIFGAARGLAVNVAVTGRTVQMKAGCLMKRVAITFVGDGEPDTVTRGWMRVR